MRKKKKYNKTPPNLGFWTYTLKRPEELKEFIKRGNKQQKDSLIHTLLYYKRSDIEFFNEIQGTKILKEIQRKNKHGKIINQ